VRVGRVPLAMFVGRSTCLYSRMFPAQVHTTRVVLKTHSRLGTGFLLTFLIEKLLVAELVNRLP
jgi:hypothetical protein